MSQSSKSGSGGDITRVNITAGTGLSGTQDTGSGEHTQTIAADVGIADDKLVQVDASDVADNDYAKFTAAGVEGRSTSEVLSDIGAAASGHAHSLNDLSDVSTSGAASGKIIKHNGSSWAVADDADTAALTTEEVQDIVGAMFTGNTETRIAATYEDGDGTIDLVVDDMTADTQLTTEAVQDIVGGMFSGNTETRVAATYEDGDGTIDLVVDDMTANTMGSGFTVAATTTGTGTTITQGDSLTIAAGTGITTTGTSDGVVTLASTVTDTNTMGSGFTVSATTDTNATTITQGDDLMFTAGTGITCETTADGTVTISSTVTDTNTQLSTEEVQDIVGAMFSGNTETRIAATYEDGDGTIDLVVDDMTANTMGSGFTVSATTDTNSTTITQGDALMFTAGTGITCETTADGTVTIASTVTDTNTTYTAGDGLDLSGTTFSTDLKSAGGLKITSTELELDVNGLGDVGTTTFGATTFGAGDYLAVADASDSNNPKKVKLPVELGLACSDETTAISTGTAKLTFRMPHAMTLTEVRANVQTAPAGSTIIIDINEGGSSILSTKLTIDASEKTSTTAATPAVISDTALADDAEMTIDFDQVGSSTAGVGVKIWLIGYR